MSDETESKARYDGGGGKRGQREERAPERGREREEEEVDVTGERERGNGEEKRRRGRRRVVVLGQPGVESPDGYPESSWVSVIETMNSCF